ncbi:B- and T-lymphocyte attenuator-like isoform X2 [Myxocyprinus asiaticus]|uniref:B- and T-lymphocyte attenuator-like isoform X2 n=1 Tax=Myxocyprinus asiaticus TaxID=70543 RepID=UPI0022223569|nr:B- and T-lymphocyte attenuator-like isoform X2 [Myxocyprinus asiaticus]
MVKDVIETICYLFASLTLLLLSVSRNTNGSEINCNASIKVPRHTLFRTPVMTVLKINCSVTIYECKNPRILWCKIYGNDCKALNDSVYIKSEWRNTAVHGGVAFLTFMNISMEDEGLYRCRVGETSVSHNINVTVTVGNEVSHNQSKTDDLNKIPGLQWLWPYVYICSGIVGLVVIVMTVSLLIFRCQETKSARNNKTTKNQYIGTQRTGQAPPSHPHHNTHSPSAQLNSACVYETPPIKTGSSSGRFSANKVASKGSHNNVSIEGEENVLVYASLNHQAMPREPKRTTRQEPEPSEYAAIRFR